MSDMNELERLRQKVALLESMLYASDETPTSSLSFSRDFTIGDLIPFGHYKQDGITDSPIYWYVADIRYKHVLLVSKDILDQRPYNTQMVSGFVCDQWQDASLRAWLNNDFCQAAFDEKELDAIDIGEVSDDEGISSADLASFEIARPHNRSCRYRLKDKIFIPTYQALYNLKDIDGLRSQPSAAILDQSDESASLWWTLCHSDDRNTMVQIGSDDSGCFVHHAPIAVHSGVRPALWLDVAKYRALDDLALGIYDRGYGRYEKIDKEALPNENDLRYKSTLALFSSVPEYAFKQMMELARSGLDVACLKVASCYREGLGTEWDLYDSFIWYLEAAKKDCPTAFGKVGYCYLRGEGVDYDSAEAVTWFQKGAKLGDTYSMVMLGRCYLSGVGISQDESEAYKLFVRAAEKGDAEAAYYAGYARLNGEGVDVNIPEGMAFMKQAVDGGFSKAYGAYDRFDLYFPD